MNFQLDLKSWSPSQHFEKIIVLCQKGGKISWFDGSYCMYEVGSNRYQKLQYIRQQSIVARFSKHRGVPRGDAQDARASPPPRVVSSNGGMRHTSMALHFYRASKKNAHEPRANFRISLFKRKYVLTNCLQCGGAAARLLNVVVVVQ